MIHPFERPKWSQQLFSVDWILLLFELRYHYAIITDKVRIDSVIEFSMDGTQMTGLKG